MKNDHTPINYQALAELRYRIRDFLAVSAEAARVAGLEPTQHQLLLAVKGMEPDLANIGLLADRLLIRHNSAVELVSRCEQHGWIERIRDAGDRRQVHVKLTAEGQRLLADLSEVHLRELESTGPALIRTLTTILESMDQPVADSGVESHGE